MELINMESLQQFVSEPVEVTIQDIQGVEKSPFLRKKVKKLGYCPDQTHLRIYFDDHYFFAVPRAAKVTFENEEWTALDMFSDLQYVIRKVCNSK